MTMDFMDVLTIRLIDTFLCCNGYKARPERPTSSSSPVIVSISETFAHYCMILILAILWIEKPNRIVFNLRTKCPTINIFMK